MRIFAITWLILSNDSAGCNSKGNTHEHHALRKSGNHVA
jgi:hypothetical protein